LAYRNQKGASGFFFLSLIILYESKKQETIHVDLVRRTTNDPNDISKKTDRSKKKVPAEGSQKIISNTF